MNTLVSYLGPDKALSLYNNYFLPAFYLLAVFMASALILTIIRFDYPSYKEVLGTGKSRLSRRLAGFILAMDYILFGTGVFTTTAGIGIILLYVNRILKPTDPPANDVNALPFRIFIDDLNYMLGGVGTGFTIYAVGFAVVTLIGKRTDYRADESRTASPAFSKSDSIKLDIITDRIIEINETLITLKRSVTVTTVCGVLLAAFAVLLVFWCRFFY